MRPLIVLAIVALPVVAHADRRALTQTVEYETQPAATTEVELDTTQSRATWGDGAPEHFALRIAVEHGAGERWDVALSQTFTQASGDASSASPFQLADLAVRGRYRFAERGELPVDVVAVGQVARQFGASAYAGEARLVVARDFGLLTVAANAIGGVTFGGEVDEPALSTGWAGGVTYELTPTWKLGGESWGALDLDHTDQYQAWAGPIVAWSPTTRLWLAATAGFGLNDRSDRFTVRGVIGLSL